MFPSSKSGASGPYKPKKRRARLPKVGSLTPPRVIKKRARNLPKPGGFKVLPDTTKKGGEPVGGPAPRKKKGGYLPKPRRKGGY